MEWLEKVRTNPAVAHWLRAFGRFGSRLGAQFAAAITYFSVLSMVPILMVAFAVVGLTVTVFFPDILDTIRAAITDAVASDASLGQQMTALVDQAFNSWQAVGMVGLLSAVWAGSVWVSHTRNAVRAMVREDFDDISAEPHPVVAVVQNIALLFALLLLLGVTAAMSTVATTARGLIRDTLDLPDGALTGWLLSLVPIAGTLLAGFLLFAFIYRVFPAGKLPTKPWLQASLLGAVGMAVLQFGTGALIASFANNAAAAVFGSVIVLMLFFNLFATLVLVIAAWIGTRDAGGATEEAVTFAEATARRGPTGYASKVLLAKLNEDTTDRVPQEVAVRATRVGVGLGAVIGTAAAGLAATVAAVVSGRRDRSR